MLTHHRRTVQLSLMSFDLPIWSTVETAATLYQKDNQRFHLLLTEPLIEDQRRQPQPHRAGDAENPIAATALTPRLLWLELSPYRVIMTMQGNGQFSYRHLWEQGIYGLSRYWLQDSALTHADQLRLRNFTRHLQLDCDTLPRHLRVEYELWANTVQLGRYVLNLEIQA